MSVGVDWSLAETQFRSYSFELEGFSSEDMSFLGNARQYMKDGIPSGTKTSTRRFGLTGNVNYIYDGRYYVDLAYRVDGSSTFGSDKKYAPFWSTGTVGTCITSNSCKAIRAYDLTIESLLRGDRFTTGFLYRGIDNLQVFHGQQIHELERDDPARMGKPQADLAKDR